MKARVKGTYEWLDFEPTALQNTEFITEGYLCIKTGEVYKKEDLVFLDEYKDTLNVMPLKSIDWQDVRERASIAAMQAMLSCGDGAFSYDGRYDDIAKSAVGYANALVKELKKE